MCPAVSSKKFGNGKLTAPHHSIRGCPNYYVMMSKTTLAATKRGTDREVAVDLSSSSIDLNSVELGVPAIISFIKHSTALESSLNVSGTTLQSVAACENHNEI
jgi:hypothetical protein